MIRRWRRLIGVMLGSGFRAASALTAVLLVSSVVVAAASVCYSLGFRMMVDGAIAHSSSRIVWGAAVVAALFTLSWVLAIFNGTLGTMLTDRTNLLLGKRIARLVASLPTLEHFENSDMLARIEQLTSDRRTLAGATRQVVGLFGQLLRAVGIVLLATGLLAGADRAVAGTGPSLFRQARGPNPTARRQRHG